VVHFSIQTDHVHLLIEARDKVSLSRGVSGLTIPFARSINRALGRTGHVFSDRYHARDLKTPREVRHGLVYVLMTGTGFFGLPSAPGATCPHPEIIQK